MRHPDAMAPSVPEDKAQPHDFVEMARLLKEQVELPQAPNVSIATVTPETVSPPRAEKLLCLFVSADRAEEVLGDFEEEYSQVVVHLGIRRARLWYIGQVVMIGLHSVLNAASKIARTWVGFEGA